MGEFTLGSLFAGIGGFDLGFERAGWESVWQVERKPDCRAVLAEHFPNAYQLDDVCTSGKHNLKSVRCITAGFPCQDISVGGSMQGLAGSRSGLFYQALRIFDELKPEWLVVENVPALLSVNDSKDFETVIRELAQRGYMGCFRVLDASYFGVPQKRRRLFMVARLGGPAPERFIFDAQPVESIPSQTFTEKIRRASQRWAGGTLCARNQPFRLTAGSEVFIAHNDGLGACLERERSVSLHGSSADVDVWNTLQIHGAGNAIVPAIATWIAEIIKEACHGH